MKHFGERLQYLMKLKKINSKSLADGLNCHMSQLTRWKKGGSSPTDDTLNKVSSFFGCDIDWLSTGEGEPYPEKNEGYIASQKEITGFKKEREEEQIEASEPETKMVRMYRQLAEMDEDTPREIQTWLNDMERFRPGFKGWFRLEFQNRFPEFDEWKNKVIKKQANGTGY